MPKIGKLVRRTLLNLAVSTKPLSVHTEAIVLDEVWKKVQKLALSNKAKVWYIMTPANFEWTKAHLNLKMSKKQYSKILKERYLWLIKNNQKLELHIHLNKFMNITEKEQEILFRESIKWAEKELGLNFREFVPGWWADNSDTQTLLKKYGLKKPKFTKYKYIHDYDLIRN